MLKNNLENPSFRIGVVFFSFHFSPNAFIYVNLNISANCLRTIFFMFSLTDFLTLKIKQQTFYIPMSLKATFFKIVKLKIGFRDLVSTVHGYGTYGKHTMYMHCMAPFFRQQPKENREIDI